MREQFGRYTLLKKIAVGGMGELYLAERPGIAGFSKRVVVKRIRSDLVHDDDFVEMFLNEGRLASMFTHPNIVQIYELGQVGGAYFMAMEYVAGQNLGDILEHLGGPIELPYAIYVMMQLCEGLGSAHDARDREGRAMRLVHRDISPPNVLISFAGEVKLTDFGIAKVARQQKQTQAGVLKGKFAYLSPEQSMGEPIDRRSDIYALGLVLFEATVGMRANPGAVEVEQIYAASQARVLQPSLHDPSYPPELERIYLKATAKAPRDRYQTAREMHRDLGDFQARHGLLVSSTQLGAFLQRLYPEDAAVEQGLSREEPDTIPPASADHQLDTAPERSLIRSAASGFEDEEATVLEQTLPPEELQTLDSSGGLMVIDLEEQPDVGRLQPDGGRLQPDVGRLQPIGYDDDDDDEAFEEESTRVAPGRPQMSVPEVDPLLLATQDEMQRSDLLAPDRFDPYAPRAPRMTGPRLPTIDPSRLPTAAQEGLVVEVRETSRPPSHPASFSSRPRSDSPGSAGRPAPPEAPRPRLQSDAVPLGRVAQPLIPAPEPQKPRRSGRAWLWLIIGLLLVLGIAGATTYFVITVGAGGSLDPKREIESDPRKSAPLPKSTEVKTTPLEDDS